MKKTIITALFATAIMATPVLAVTAEQEAASVAVAAASTYTGTYTYLPIFVEYSGTSTDQAVHVIYSKYSGDRFVDSFEGFYVVQDGELNTMLTEDDASRKELYQATFVESGLEFTTVSPDVVSETVKLLDQID